MRVPGVDGSAWLAGAAEFDITPPLGVELCGYAGRPGPAEFVRDRLAVRALALQAGDAPPVVLTCADLLGIEPGMVARIRALVADEVAPKRLLLNHSHTHAGPTASRLRCMGEPDPAYADLVVRWTASAVREALRSLRPARLAFGTAEAHIGRNRREPRDGRIVLGDYPAGARDPTVSVLRVEDAAGRPLACWFSHAAHPVVLGSENTGISADWPGAAARALAAVLGCPAVFAQGCCGDVNPVRRGDYGAVESIGRELAGAALQAWERAEPLPASSTTAALETIRLPQSKPTVGEAERVLAEARDRAAAAPGEADGPERERRRRQIPFQLLRWAEDYLAAARAEGEPSAPMDVQAIRIGDAALLATGAETFVEIGLAVREQSPFPRTVPLGYSNGCFGYLPTRRAFPLGGYEIETAFKYYGTLMVTPDCEQLTLEAAARVLNRVARAE